MVANSTARPNGMAASSTARYNCTKPGSTARTNGVSFSSTASSTARANELHGKPNANSMAMSEEHRSITMVMRDIEMAKVGLEPEVPTGVEAECFSSQMNLFKSCG